MAASKPKKKQVTRARERDLQELATILSYAATHGIKAASVEFSISRRTIERHRAAVEDGKAPKLAALVAGETTKAAERNRSKLHRTLDVFLDRAMELAPSAKLSEVLSGVEKIGDLVTQRQVLIGEGDSEGQGAAEAQGLGGPAASSEAAPAVH